MLWDTWADSQNSMKAFDVYWLPWSLCRIRLPSAGCRDSNAFCSVRIASPALACSRILYGACLALLPAFWGGRWSADPFVCSCIYGWSQRCSRALPALDKPPCCGSRPLRYGCDRCCGSAPEPPLFGHNNPPSGVSGGYSRHSDRSPAASATSGHRILPDDRQ